jgi:AcrR family transcriptional regulator
VSTKVRTADTRERILTAACEVIADIGFEKIRMRMVAERAGVSTALLHYHFDTREKLFTEAMTHSFAHTALDVERDAESAPAAVVLARILRSVPDQLSEPLRTVGSDAGSAHLGGDA